MKKKLLIIIPIVLVILAAPFLFYWRSIAVSVLLSAMDLQYGLSLDYKKFDFDIFPGNLSIERPVLRDASFSPSIRLGAAKQVDLSVNVIKAIRGNVDVKQINGQSIQVDLAPAADGKLNWSKAIERVVKQKDDGQIIALADVKKPDKKPAAPPDDALSKIPSIELEDIHLNYLNSADAEKKSTVINLGRLEFYPDNQQMKIENSRVFDSTSEDALFSFKNLNIQNMMKELQNCLVIEADGVRLDGRQISNDRYDYNDIGEIWFRVYSEISSSMLGAKPAVEVSGSPVVMLKVTNANIRILPASVAGKESGEIVLNADQVEYDGIKDELTISNAVLEEDGKSLLLLNRIVLGGVVKGETTVERLVAKGGRLDIREDKQGGLNVVRAVNCIRSVIESLLPKSTKTTAMKPAPLEELKYLAFEDSVVALHRTNVEDQRMTTDFIEYRAESNVLSASGISWSKVSGARNSNIDIHSITAIRNDDQEWKSWKQAVFHDARVQCAWLPDQFELVNSASDWIQLGKRVSQGIAKVSEEEISNPITIGKLSIVNANFNIEDRTIEQPIMHRLDDFNATWSDLIFGKESASLAPLIMSAVLLEPSPGTLVFNGSVSPSGPLFNMKGEGMLFIVNIDKYHPYLYTSDKALPVRIENGGMRIKAKAAIVDDQVDGIIDLELINPVFKPVKSGWPLKIDQRTVITALNGMKDKNGVIAFNNNKWTGDIRDPKFKQGLGIGSVLWSNVNNGLRNVLKLPVDIAESGVNMVKKGVGSVGNLFNKIIGN